MAPRGGRSDSPRRAGRAPVHWHRRPPASAPASQAGPTLHCATPAAALCTAWSSSSDTSKEVDDSRGPLGSRGRSRARAAWVSVQ